MSARSGATSSRPSLHRLAADSSWHPTRGLAFDDLSEELDDSDDARPLPPVIGFSARYDLPSLIPFTSPIVAPNSARELPAWGASGQLRC